VERKRIDRRQFLKTAAGGVGVTAATLHAPFIMAQPAKIKVGLMLPYTGTFAMLGAAIQNGFRLYVAERGGKIAGRELEYVNLDDESDSAKAAENANRLVNRDKVDVLVGTVHSGVQMGMIKIARESGVLLIIPNAGVGAATGELCAPNIFRSSFSNWQTIHALGKVMMEKGHKTAAWISWKYAAGEERFASFKEGYEKVGGKIVRELWLPFPNVEFQPLLTDLAASKPDAVACFFAGGGAVKFTKDYEAAGLKAKIPLYGDFVTDGTLQAQGSSAQGILTTLHYADDLDLPKNREFRLNFAKTYKQQPDVNSMHGYDAAQLFDIGMKAAKGDIRASKAIAKGIEDATVDSPRGKFTISKSHNPIQDIYLRQAVGDQNKFVSVAWRALADPARGCKMA
jgi:branched-chain amino acid transport system substrate-binding protein